MKLPWSKAPSSTGTAVFRLAAPLQPMHRGEHFEDPLEERLAEEELGTIQGGGTQMTDEGAIEYCEIEVDLHVSPPEQAAERIAQIITELGAPAGSFWTLDGRNERHPFGTAQGIAIKLDGRTLPEEVYATSDVNELLAQLFAAMGDVGRLLSWREGPETSDLFFYGADAEAIEAAALPVLAAHPLGQNHQIERLT